MKTDQPTPALVQQNPWDALRQHTAARIALGRVGASLPTAEILKFGLAHARARDAVHDSLDADALEATLRSGGWRVLRARSQADSRQTYLLRPDLGRKLDSDSRARLDAQAPAPELAIVLADGLSAIAVQQHAAPLLDALRKQFDTDWPATPAVIVEQGRVAVGDDVGAALRAKLVIVLIGERPGLSSPDSLGVYFTYEPRVGRMDSERNCISNVRPEGLPIAAAAFKLAHMIKQALRLRLTGVGLKDDAGAAALPDSDIRRI